MSTVTRRDAPFVAPSAPVPGDAHAGTRGRPALWSRVWLRLEQLIAAIVRALMMGCVVDLRALPQHLEYEARAARRQAPGEPARPAASARESRSGRGAAGARVA